MRTSDLPPAFVAVLHRQRGIFTGVQARGHGVSEAVVRANIRAERWRALGRNVYAGFTGPLHERHRAWFAILAAEPVACLSHETAADHHGLLRASPSDVHVLIPEAQGVRRVPGVVVHRTRSHGSRLVTGAPPVTSVADTLCDLSASGWSSRRLAGLVTDAVQRRLTNEFEIRTAMRNRGPFPGIAGLRALARDTGAGAESVLELRFLRDVERAHRLPRGERQSRVRRRDGRTTYRDVHYPAFSVTVELDGREHHGSLDARLRDARRDRLAADDGEITLRYGWLDIAEHACLAARELADALASRGWGGRFRTCPSCGS